MPQDQAGQEVPAAGFERRGLARPEWRGGRQGQSAGPLEGPVGPPSAQVPTARQERQVLDVPGRREERALLNGLRFVRLW